MMDINVFLFRCSFKTKAQSASAWMCVHVSLIKIIVRMEGTTLWFEAHGEDPVCILSGESRAA
jgi:hypothetical protein